MKRLMIAFVATMSLMLGIVGSAAAVQPDNAACGAVGSHADAATALLSPAFSGDPVCDSHTR